MLFWFPHTTKQALPYCRFPNHGLSRVIPFAQVWTNSYPLLERQGLSMYYSPHTGFLSGKWFIWWMNREGAVTGERIVFSTYIAPETQVGESTNQSYLISHCNMLPTTCSCSCRHFVITILLCGKLELCHCKIQAFPGSSELNIPEDMWHETSCTCTFSQIYTCITQTYMSMYVQNLLLQSPPLKWSKPASFEESNARKRREKNQTPAEHGETKWSGTNTASSPHVKENRSRFHISFGMNSHPSPLNTLPLGRDSTLGAGRRKGRVSSHSSFGGER